MRMDWIKYDMEQLQAIADDLNRELAERRKVGQQRAWDKVVEALKDYMTEYGEIQVHDDYRGTIVLTSADLETDIIGELYERV